MNDIEFNLLCIFVHSNNIMITAQNFFSKEEVHKIISAIQTAEASTSAEIRVHIENFCFFNPLKRAEKIFIQNKMHHTQDRNAVLFYFAVISRKLAIIGDKGIYEKVERKVWEEMVHQLINALKNNTQKAETLCECVEKIGRFLALYFPAKENNPNELSDEISY